MSEHASGWTVLASCRKCEAMFSEFALRTKAKATRANRMIWMETHYARTGHHVFSVGDTNWNRMDVAKVPDANVPLSEDSNYETMHLGGGNGELSQDGLRRQDEVHDQGAR